MNWLMKRIDLFCYRHPRFGIPNLMIYVVIGNAVVWLFSLMDRSGALLNAIYFSPQLILKGQIWRLITFIFIPTDTSWTALLFFYFFYFIGNTLEQQWGPGRFTIYFFTGVILSVIYGFAAALLMPGGQLIGVFFSAHYIYMSMFFSFAALYPETQVLLFFIIPVKMKWLALIDAAYFIYRIIVTPFPLNLLPVVAVLNFFIFCGSMLTGYFKPASRAQRHQRSNFKSEVRRIRYEEARRPYKQKCEVCGRTDVSNPGLEFRYCSRCEGYHCYCIDHINNHTHVR